MKPSQPSRPNPRSKILQVTVDWLQPLLLLFSLFLLLRGHNSPGGGFSGGLVAGSAFILAALARGTAHVQAQLPCSASTLVKTGLFCAITAGLLPLLFGKVVFAALWIEPKIPVIGTAGSFLLFDAGVYLLVMGFVIGVLAEMAQDVHHNSPERGVDTDAAKSTDTEEDKASNSQPATQA
ncbi:MAG: multicomponent Na+:H+ antiporter subunit B [Candidatus Azotimanducaceae bacterium]|jgi:multisubunit Na+/H+ antiporter MnhB subunit